MIRNASVIMTTVTNRRTQAINSLSCISSGVNQIDKRLEGRALFRGSMAFLILVSRGHDFLGMIILRRCDKSGGDTWKRAQILIFRGFRKQSMQTIVPFLVAVGGGAESRK